jgi:hypothetical protein
MGWSGERARFTELIQNIERQVRNADKAANAANISASHERHDQLVALMSPQPAAQLSIDCKVLRYPRNSIFQDRPDILDKMHEQLKPTPSAPGLRLFALYGIGGVGKTQLALEYCYRNRSTFPAIFWVSAERQDQIFQDFGTISQYLGLDDGHYTDQRRVRDQVLVWMSKNG